MERGAGAWLQGFDVSRPHTTVPALIYSRHLPRPARSDVNSCVAVPSWRADRYILDCSFEAPPAAAAQRSLPAVGRIEGGIPGGAGTHTGHTGAHRHTDHTVGAIDRGEIFGNLTRQRHSHLSLTQRPDQAEALGRVRGKPTTRDLSGIPSLQPRVPPRAVLGRASALDMEDTRTGPRVCPGSPRCLSSFYRYPRCLFTGTRLHTYIYMYVYVYMYVHV